MVELSEVLIRDIHAAALEGELPNGVYPVSVSVRLDRAKTADKTDTELRPPRYPVEVKWPVNDSPYIPESVVWLENPAIVDNRGEKIWDHRKFSETMQEERELIKNKDPKAVERFYLSKAKFVEIVDKSYLIEDKIGRLRPTPGFFEDYGEMSIAYFNKRPTITNDEVRQKLKDEGALSGQVKQPLRLTRYDKVRAKPHNPSQSTRRFFTGGQARNFPGVEAVDVKPRVYKLPDEITDRDRKSNDIIVHELQVGLDSVERDFPVLSQSDLWLKAKFVGDYDQSERFIESDVILNSAPA